MKKNLGKILLFLSMLLLVNAQAKQLATYKLYANKQEAYAKEPIEVTFVAQQVEHKNIMFFFVEPKKNDDYKIELLTKNIQDNSHNNTTTFKYILFPLKAKKIDINFNFIIKIASDNSVAHAYVTDHDESKGIEGETSKIQIKPLTIKIKKLAHNVDLVGDFTLKSQIDREKINQYESTNLIYTFYGTGYADKISLLNHLDNVTIFSDINDLNYALTKDGYNIKKEYIYSLNAKQNFTIPPITLKAYSPKKDKFYTLNTTSYKIEVDKINSTDLLNNEENPENKNFIDSKTVKQYLIYFIIFLFGYVTAKFTKKIYKVKKVKRFQDIKDSKEPLELILILLKNYKDRDIDKFITELEAIKFSNKADKNFEEMKKIILGTFTSFYKGT
jgi:hypothetical protein